MTKATADTSSQPRWVRQSSVALLALGYVLLGLGLTGALQRGSGAGLPADAAARVNGTLITRAQLTRLEQGSRQARAQLLRGLIDDELLVQHASALGLTDQDELVRRRAVQLAIELARAPVHTAEVDDATLRQHHGQHRERFTRHARLKVTQLFLPKSDADAEAKLEEWSRELARGASWAKLSAQSQRPPIVYEGFVTLRQLEEYYGAQVSEALARTSVGSITDVVDSAFGKHVFRVMARDGGELLAFEQAKDLVLADFRRTRGEQLLSEHLARLRNQARIEIAPDLEALSND